MREAWRAQPTSSGEAPSLSLQGLLERIERAAGERSGGYLHDDIALLALRVSLQPTGER